MTIGLDIDGVLRNLYEPLIEKYRASEIGRKRGSWIRSIGAWTSYKVHEQTSIGNKIYRYWFHEWAPEIYTKALPYWNEITDARNLHYTNHDIKLISAQPNMYCELYTLSWLCNNHIPHSSIHFTNDKWGVECDVYIDDSPEQIIQYVKHERCCFILDRPWNKTFDYNEIEEKQKSKLYYGGRLNRLSDILHDFSVHKRIIALSGVAD